MVYKIKHIIPILLFANTFFCFGQKKYDLRFETSMLYLPKVTSGYSAASLISSKNHLGYGANLLGSYCFNTHFSISSGVQIGHYKLSFTSSPYHAMDDIYETEVKSRDISFPLLTTYNFFPEKKKSFFISAGMLWGTNSPTKTVTTDQSGVSTFNPDMDMITPTEYFAALVGAGAVFKMTESLSLYARSELRILNKGLNARDQNFITNKQIAAVNIGLLYKL